MLQTIISFWTNNSAVIAGVLVAVVALDTALAEIPAVKSNSTFQLIDGTVRKILSVVFGKSV